MAIPTRYNELIDHPDFKLACEWLCISPDNVRDGLYHSWNRNLQNDQPRDRIRLHKNWKIDGEIVPADWNSAVRSLVLFGTFFASESDLLMNPSLILGTAYTWELNFDQHMKIRLLVDYKLESLD
jgi:hypothetical protein